MKPRLNTTPLGERDLKKRIVFSPLSQPLILPLKNMRQHFLFLLLCTALWGCADEPGETKPLPPELQAFIDEMRKAHAPDKRVALLQLEPEFRNGKWIIRGETNLPEAQTELEDGLMDLGVGHEVELLPAENLKGKHYGIVRLSACNIRSEAQHSAELSTQATLGTPLNVYKKEEDWYLVQTPDGYLGWLDEAGFTPMDESVFQAWKARQKVVFLPDFGMAYASPSVDAHPVSDLLAGNILAGQSAEEGFVKVQFPDGRTGYVPEKQLMPYQQWLNRPAPDAAQILRTAERFLGRPYLWGGTSGKAMDCSGFTKTVFFLNGLMLPRDASQQVHSGVEVQADTSLQNLQAGDLLFFGRAATADAPEKITHVAIYRGDGEMIHAAGMVKVESLRPGTPNFAPERLMTFVRAKRFLSEREAVPGVVPLEELAGY
jgi:gamma-D-glutamyl-L-lysine dipeptidyl-peptidase